MKNTEKQESTYYGEALTKVTDKVMDETRKEPTMPQRDKIARLETLFIRAAIDCINDLDARLRKLEQK